MILPFMVWLRKIEKKRLHYMTFVCFFGNIVNIEDARCDTTIFRSNHQSRIQLFHIRLLELQCGCFRCKATHLPVGRNRIFSLLLEVFGVRVLSSPDGGLVDLNSRVPVLKHQPSVGCALLSVLCKLGFVYRLNREGAVGV
jgi:hypothetical protein